MDDLSAYIARYYDSSAGDEWERLERHRTEFAVTMRALKAHLPLPPARLLDCGGGPGRYSIELARRGYSVTLFDISAGNLRLALEKSTEAELKLDDYVLGNATDLSAFANDSFDAVLLMGPLYHLLAGDDREKALSEAARVLKPGGIMMVAFISRYAAHRYAACFEPEKLISQPEVSEAILQNGKLIPREGGAFVAYLAHPLEVAPFCLKAGLEVIEVLGVEGLVSLIDQKINQLSGELWDGWVEINSRLADDPSLHGSAEHLLVVAQKPLWRPVLRQIAERLNSDGLHYKVVGGGSATLQGVPIPVKDLDLEMDAQGAYRFQELFPDQVLEPVELYSTDAYRSHFGRFDFNGFQVEVMGDYHRKEKGVWVPTWTVTQREVELDDVLVNVSWLEEEILTYIRRGRLERASQCLMYANQERLLALLRREQPTNVL